MYEILNILSLAFGFTSWGFGIAAAARRKTGFSALGFCLCALALICWIFYTQHLVVLGDWSAIEDTHRAGTLAATVLLAGNLLLNLPALAKKK